MRSAALHSREPKGRGKEAQQAAGQTGREKVARLAASPGHVQSGEHAEGHGDQRHRRDPRLGESVAGTPKWQGDHERDQQPKPSGPTTANGGATPAD